MNIVLALILSASLAVSAATKHDAGIRLVRPAEPVYVDIVDAPHPTPVQAVSTPDPLAPLPDTFFVGDSPTIGEVCQIFVDKQCATDMRPHTHGE